jgi:AcrR family transcriptional regulator
VAPSTPQTEEKPAGPRSRKGAVTRARLLQAAKEIFEEQGFLDSRISDIAERAGLSHGSFYHYFDSKEEVFREVAEAVEAKLSAPMGRVILDPSSHLPPRERIRRALREHLEAYREEARIMGVIELMTRYDAQLAAVRAERSHASNLQVAESIRRLQRHGLADPDLDPVVAAAVVGSMTNRFPEMWLVQGMVDCSFDEGVDQITEVFLNALRIGEPEAGAAGGGSRQTGLASGA